MRAFRLTATAREDARRHLPRRACVEGDVADSIALGHVRQGSRESTVIVDLAPVSGEPVLAYVDTTNAPVHEVFVIRKREE